MDAAPSVSTDAATDIEPTSFTANMTVSGGGNVTDVTERGFAWFQGSSGTPETTDNVEFETGNFGNAFSWGTTINTLMGGTDYRVRAYAINSVGTTYGDTITVSTPSDQIDLAGRSGTSSRASVDVYIITPETIAGRSSTPSRASLTVGDTEVSLSGRSATPTRSVADIHIVTPEVIAGRSSTSSRAALALSFADFDPLNLSVILDDTTAHLTWDPSPGDVIDYQVFRRSPQTGEPFDPTIDEPIAVGVAAVAEPSYDDTNLESGAYDWQVFGRVRG